MKITFRKPPTLLFPALFLSFALVAGAARNHIFSEDSQFRSFTREVFQKEVSGSMLTLHYSLADPEKKNITRPAPTLGTVSYDNTASIHQCQEYLKKLLSFSYSDLSRENRLTSDMLLLYFHTSEASLQNGFPEEILSPSLGIQAQLPVLLAEYAFYKEQDISDYLNILVSIEPYFESILQYEQERAYQGYFMSDTTLDRILEQCREFVKDPENNYMLDVFSRKLKEYGKFTDSEQNELMNRHKEILLNKVIPAYEKLIIGLNALRGSGKNPMGLTYYKKGQKHYEYLLQTETGCYDSVKKIQQRLYEQLADDTARIQMMLKEQPSLLQKMNAETDLDTFQPTKALQILQKKSEKDFPALPETVSPDIRYVHKSMESYSSPAFYLTPPLDTGSPNVIYINPSSQTSNLELFTTLSHEGFPGHLYQTVYFGSCDPDDIRYLITSSGYVEGWATYVESYGYQYAADYLDDPAASDLTALAWMNRSINLCIYSLMDIGIHYHGWTPDAAASFLKNFGITDTFVVQEIYQYIVETPGNYLKYYLGYLNFLDLRQKWQDTLGEHFDLKKFHQKILETGPVSFPVLQKYMDQELSEKGEAISLSLTLSYNCQKISATS